MFVWRLSGLVHQRAGKWTCKERSVQTERWFARQSRNCVAPKANTIKSTKRVTKKHSVSVCLVGLSGLEPPTPTLSGWCSNLLSYNPIVCGGDTRIRLVASDCACTSKRASARTCPRGHHKVMRCARNGMRVYSPMVEIHGFEPRTSWMQIRRSTNWAISPRECYKIISFAFLFVKRFKKKNIVGGYFIKFYSYKGTGWKTCRTHKQTCVPF